MLVGTDERCARCGTLLRGGRNLCPSCGLDQKSAEANPVLNEAALVAPKAAEVKAAPNKKSICPACMNSVRDDTMVAYEDSRICPDCAERIKEKKARKA